MIHSAEVLKGCLLGVAFIQLVVAGLNLVLVRIMGWKREIDTLSSLVREVFHVHSIFISVTLGIFSVLTFRFAEELAHKTNPIGAWVSASIAVFWTIRAVMQWTFYSTTHWRGNFVRTCIHWLLTLTYTAFAAIYLAAAI